MKNKLKQLFTLASLLVCLSACTAPHQPLKVHATPGQPQKPNGCVMENGHCKPAGL